MMKTANMEVLLFKAFFLLACLSGVQVQAWTSSPTTMAHIRTVNTPTTLHAVSNIETLDGTTGIAPDIIHSSSAFMMDAFWGVTSGDAGLLAEQKSDLETRFGEILGKRKLFSSLILARSEDGAGDDIEGLVGVEVGLLDLTSKDILSYKESEKVITNAVASLGPKQRRQFKDSSIEELVAELPDLNGNYEAVAVLANLCVSQSARGKGIGGNLCEGVETVVRDQWSMHKIMLKVEADNTPARKLYGKLGFVEDWTNEGSTALRPTEGGSFDEITCDIVLMSKTL